MLRVLANVAELAPKLTDHEDQRNMGIQTYGAERVNAVVEALVLHQQYWLAASNRQAGCGGNALIFVAGIDYPDVCEIFQLSVQ